MKLPLKMFLGIIMMTAVATPQKHADRSIAKQIVQQQQEPAKPIALAGSHFLREKEQAVREYLNANPGAMENLRLSKSMTDFGFTVGSTRNWWATDLTVEDIEYEVPSTCRAVGEYCYIFVEDALWEEGGNGRVTQAAVDAVRETFDETTPSNANKGIYELDVETFGEPPNVDNDDRIIILILDIIDGDPVGYYLAGYFWGINEVADNTLTIGGKLRRSNEAEIYYLDADPGNLADESGFERALATTTHEFQHMIHYAGDENGESTFVNEGCAELAMVVCGYDLESQSLYNNDPNVNLFYWDTEGGYLEGYSRASRWTLYLWEQIPNNFIYNLVQHDQNENSGIDGALIQTGSPRRFMDIFSDWVVANYLNDTSVDPEWGYDYSQSPIGQPVPVNTYYTPTDGLVVSTVQKLGVEYVTFKAGSVDSVLITGSTAVKIKAIKIGSPSVVEDVPIGTAYPTPSLKDSTYDEITFAIHVPSPYAFFDSYDYEYTGIASGGGGEVTVEQSFDDGIPNRVPLLFANDTITVQFNGVSNATIQSVQIAFEKAGTIDMKVSKFIESYNPSPIGTTLAQREVTSDNSSLVPYPTPFDNWVTIDLRDDKIDASEDFIISFPVGIDPSTPGIIASSMPDDGERHSVTWYNNPDDPGPGWYYFEDGNIPGNILNYMVRATLCIGCPTIEVESENIVTIPSAYQLSENFPNPFNPSTTFTYDITEPGEVHFAIYDLIGRLIYEEQRTHLPGQYSLRWNGVDSFERKVGSGMYLLRMQINGFSATRKMVLLK